MATVNNLLLEHMIGTTRWNALQTTSIITRKHAGVSQNGVIISLHVLIKPRNGKCFVLRRFIGFGQLSLTSPLLQLKL